MRILAVNAGSSSLKLSVVTDNDAVDDEQETDGDTDPVMALREFAARAGGVDAVAHRLVHGGSAIRHAVIVDDHVRHQLDAAIELAPLHVPPALALLDAARASIDRPQIVCVDTSFHAEMPEFATTYALPAQWRDWGVRRYGFHGLSYAWSSRRSAELLQRPADHLQVVIAHIGSGFFGLRDSGRTQRGYEHGLHAVGGRGDVVAKRHSGPGRAALAETSTRSRSRR